MTLSPTRAKNCLALRKRQGSVEVASTALVALDGLAKALSGNDLICLQTIYATQKLFERWGGVVVCDIPC